MELADLARSFGSLGLVLGLMWLAAWAIKKFRLVPGVGGARKGVPPRVSVVSRTPIDAKHTLIIVKRDIYEHLILIGPSGMLLVEQNIISGGGQ